MSTLLAFVFMCDISMGRKSGFTLIELMIVIAIIGVLTSVVLAVANSVREKAEWARYIGYVSSVSRLVSSAATLGALEGHVQGERGCLGLYSGNECWGDSGTRNILNVPFNDNLEVVGAIPVGVFAPGSDFGTDVLFSDGGRTIHIQAYVGIGNQDMCDRFGWPAATTLGDAACRGTYTY